MNWRRVFAWLGVIFLILLIPTAFAVGRIIGEMRNMKPMLNHCIPDAEIPYDNYYEVSINKHFEQKHRLFYGEHKYKFNKIIIPDINITYEEYYDSLGAYGKEYFISDSGIIIECGVYK